MDSVERGMNLVAMTIINPGKKYWPSRRSKQGPPVLKSALLPTEERPKAWLVNTAPGLDTHYLQKQLRI